MKGHIRERSPGHWAIVLDVQNAAGKRKRRWHSFQGTKRAAQIECARLISESAAGLFIEPAKVTVAAFLDRWLDHMRSQLTPKSHERYSDLVRKNITPSLGAVPLRKLAPVQISDCYARALASGRRDGRGGLSATTIIYMHRIIKQALGQAVLWQLLPYNPAAAVKPPRAERVRMTTYDIPQTAALIEGLRGTRLLVPVPARGDVRPATWRDRRSPMATYRSCCRESVDCRERRADGGRRALQAA